MDSGKADELDWESMPEDEQETKSRECNRMIKMGWFCAGDIFTEAVLFLASLEGDHNKEFIPMNLLRTCCETYGERKGWKISPLRVKDDEWTAAQTGDANQRRPVWIDVALNLQEAAWESLEAPAL